MSKATFYEHFDNKEDCIVALFDAGAEAVIEAMRRAGAQAATPARPAACGPSSTPTSRCSRPSRTRPRRCSSRSSARARARSSGATAPSPSSPARSTTSTARTPSSAWRRGWPRAHDAFADRGRGGRARVAPDPHGRAPTSPRARAGHRAARVGGPEAGRGRRHERRPPAAGPRAAVHECRRCPRLVAWREQVAAEKRAAFRDEDYWGRPIPGFGDPARGSSCSALRPPPTAATAPGASSPATARATSSSRPAPRRLRQPADVACAATTASAYGLLDHGGGALRAAGQQAAARRARHVRCLARARAAAAAARARDLCLGGFAWDAALRLLDGRRAPEAALRPRGRGAPPGAWTLLGCFHPSQQNTFTGRLTAGDARRGARAGAHARRSAPAPAPRPRAARRRASAA